MVPDKDPYILLIPKKTLHGFMSVSTTPAILLNFPTALYDSLDELRIPHKQANMKISTGEFFTWDVVRKKFPKLSKSSNDI